MGRWFELPCNPKIAPTFESVSASERARPSWFAATAWGKNFATSRRSFGVLGPPDHAHPALADLLDQAVVRQVLARLERHLSPRRDVGAQPAKT